jgi:hypothetical protein
LRQQAHGKAGEQGGEGFRRLAPQQAGAMGDSWLSLQARPSAPHSSMNSGAMWEISSLAASQESIWRMMSADMLPGITRNWVSGRSMVSKRNRLVTASRVQHSISSERRSRSSNTRWRPDASSGSADSISISQRNTGAEALSTTRPQYTSRAVIGPVFGRWTTPVGRPSVSIIMIADVLAPIFSSLSRCAT